MPNDYLYLKDGVAMMMRRPLGGPTATPVLPLNRDIELEFKVTVKLEERQVNYLLLEAKEAGNPDPMGLFLHRVSEEIRALDPYSPHRTHAIDSITVELMGI